MTDNRRAAAQFVATLEARDWDGWSALLHPEVVYELPQSRERIRGRDRYLRFNRDYPGDWHLTANAVVADATDGAVWFQWTVGVDRADGVVFFSFDGDGLITRVTDFWPEPYDPPTGREHLVERW
ncbi:MAG: nuclear transport factor 2 family protein [Nocardioidaceae bacterium]